MSLLLIGNLISMVSAVFTALANWTTDRKRSYYYQMWQCLILAIAYLFFGSYAGITTLLLCGARNYLISAEKYSFKVCIFFVIAVGAAGAAVNNSGIVGVMIVGVTIIYTIASYFCVKIIAVKLNILFNCICWIIYELFCRDYVSAAVEVITTSVLVVSLIRLLITRNIGKGPYK